MDKTENRLFEIKVAPITEERELADAVDMTIVGNAISFDDEADMPWGKEKIDRKAFDCTEPITLNLFHDRTRIVSRSHGGGLKISASNDGILFEAQLANTQDGREAFELVKSKVLTAASIEFISKKEKQDGDTRIIQEGRLLGIAIVDRGAYPKASVQSRKEEDKPKKKWRFWY